jgi:hypothetical protein
VRRKIRNAAGSLEPTIARTATAKAMSVAVGIADVDGGEDQGGNEDAAERGGHRHDRLADLP